MNIRQATLEDVDFLVKAWLTANYARLATRADWHEERFIRGFTDQTIDEVEGREVGSVTYVVEDGGVPVGRLRLVRSSEEIFVAGIQIAPEHQSKGVGREVLRSLISDAKVSGLKLTLEVEKDNPRAKALYLDLGFQVTEDRHDRELMVFHASS